MARKSLKASLLAFSIGAASLLIPSGFTHAAEPELYFYPAQGWQVAPSPFAKASSSKSCTISNEFNNGFLVQIVGTANGLTTLMIDFRQPAFEAGEAYDLTLNVPGKTTRSVSALASKAELLVIDMKDLQDLNNGLRSSSVFDMTVTDNSFRFFLTGFADATKRFDACVSGAERAVPEAPVIQEAKTAPPPAPTKTAQTDFIKPSVSSKAPPPPQDIDVYETPIAEMGIEKPAKPETIAIQEIIPQRRSQQVIEASADQNLSQKPPKSRGYKRLTERLAEQMANEKPSTTPMKTAYAQKPAPGAGSANPGLDSQQTNKILEQMERDQMGRVEAPKPAQEKVVATVDTTKSPKRIKIEDISAEMGQKPEAKAIPAEKPKEAIKKAPRKMARVKEEKLEEINIPRRPPIKSPPIKVTRERYKANIDISKLGDVEPASSRKSKPFTPAARGTGSAGMNDDMRIKLTNLQRTVNKLSEENSALENELKASLKESEQELLSVSSENWNLERATMRYNEAERQIDRLGRQLQSERMQCKRDSQKLESMLFDPALTNQKQLARFSELERELQASKQSLAGEKRKYEARIQLLEKQLSVN